ncbi:hypothetical protein GCM10011519_05170 [Marmoricola endophyticus]|uniref:Uncharacterized protein n=2 Tax=Marmoricola endophyticus TaxID=2040280 RepID=A0A917EZB5_9ACTN|nr:hypothetical protein GCM10011519_05170 [Marmoricola endophyticus]
MALNVAVPPDLQWSDERREVTYVLTSITVRVLPDGTLAAKAYGGPEAGGRGGYTSFPVPDRPELADLVDRAAAEAARRWAARR